MSTHKCPHPDCTQQVAPDQFACGMHWLRLPAGLRHLINRRYRDYVKRRSMYHLGALRRAQAEGIEFFTPKEVGESGKQELRKCPVHGIPDCSPLLNGCSWNPEGGAQ